MRKIFAVMLALVFVFSMIGPLAVADGYDYAYKNLDEMETSGVPASDDKMLIYDESAEAGKTYPFSGDAPAWGGDVTFQEDLLTTGRKGGASTVSSSSTNLAPSSLPYTVVRKGIGAASGLDSEDGGTRLQNGTAGQMLVLIAITREGSGTWIVTPDLSLTFNTLTFDAVGETTTLLYVNDTVGWIVFANYGTTVDPIVTDF